MRVLTKALAPSPPSLFAAKSTEREDLQKAAHLKRLAFLVRSNYCATSQSPYNMTRSRFSVEELTHFKTR